MKGRLNIYLSPEIMAQIGALAAKQHLKVDIASAIDIF